MKLLASTVEGAKAAVRARKTIGGRIPQPVDDTGRTPALWSDCTAYVVDDDPAATVDDQDLIAAVAAGKAKLRPADDSPTKMRARLGPKLAKAKTNREAGKRIKRDKPAHGEDQRDNNKTKADK